MLNNKLLREKVIEMKFVIEGNGVKVFGKAIHALSRIGDEMWLDPLDKGLAVRSVNSCQSAYGCFVFTPLFFQHFILPSDAQQGCKAAKCKLNMKCVLPLFRCVCWRDRSVDRCEIYVSTTDNRVKFQFHCRHGITKTYNLGYQECEALQAVFPAHLCPNALTAQPRLLGDIVMHFPASQEEVTLSVSPVKMTVKTFCEEENSRMKGMNTELSLHPDEFDYFQVGVDSAVTFCLKELRGLLSFAESYGLPVSGQFGEAGQPVAFGVEDMMLEANIVLSTLTDQKHKSPCLPAASNDSVVCPVDTLKTAVADFCTRDGSVGTQTADVATLQLCSADGEHITSSQGSEFFSPALHMIIQHHVAGETQQRSNLAPESTSATPVTPDTLKMHSLLFGAVFSDGGGSITGHLPSLVCASDTEEDEGLEKGFGEQHVGFLTQVLHEHRDNIK